MRPMSRCCSIPAIPFFVSKPRSDIKKHIKMVGTTGFEPATLRTPSVRATRLRYVPKIMGDSNSHPVSVGQAVLWTTLRSLQRLRQRILPPTSRLPLHLRFNLWSGEQDSNLRPLASKASTLTRLRYPPVNLVASPGLEPGPPRFRREWTALSYDAVRYSRIK